MRFSLFSKKFILFIVVTSISTLLTVKIVQRIEFGKLKLNSISNPQSERKHISTIELQTLKHSVAQRSLELESSCPIGPINDYDAITNMENLMNWQIVPEFKIMGCLPEGITTNTDLRLLFYNIREVRRLQLGIESQNYTESFLSSRENITIWEKVNTNLDFIKFMIVKHPLARVYESFWEDDDVDNLKIPNVLEDNHRLDEWKFFLDEFIAQIQNQTGKIESRLIPINKFCQPCKLEIDYLLKIETIEADVKLLLGVLNEILPDQIFDQINAELSDFLAVENCYNLEKISEFYRVADLTKEQILAIQKFYKRDMYLFGYYFDERKLELGSH